MGAHAVTGSATTKKPTKPSSGRPEPNLAGRSSYIRNGLRFLVVSTITSPITRLGAREARSKPSLMFKLSLIAIWVKISLHSDHLGRRCRQGERNCVTCNAPSCDLKIFKNKFLWSRKLPPISLIFLPQPFLCVSLQSLLVFLTECFKERSPHFVLVLLYLHLIRLPLCRLPLLLLLLLNVGGLQLILVVGNSYCSSDAVIALYIGSENH